MKSISLLPSSFITKYIVNKDEITRAILGKFFSSVNSSKDSLSRKAPRTKVIFYIEDNTTLAVFPNEKYNPHFDGNLVVCYSRTGQHSALDPTYLQQCKLATTLEYNSLQQELESIGYNLDIVNHSLEFPTGY